MILWYILGIVTGAGFATGAVIAFIKRDRKCQREGCKCHNAPHNDACEACQCCPLSNFDYACK